MNVTGCRSRSGTAFKPSPVPRQNHQQKIGAEQEGKRAPRAGVHVKSSWGEEEVYVASGNHFGVVHGAVGGWGGVYVHRHGVFNPAAGIWALRTRAGVTAARRARRSGGRGVNVSVGGTGAPRKDESSGTGEGDLGISWRLRPGRAAVRPAPGSFSRSKTRVRGVRRLQAAG